VRILRHGNVGPILSPGLRLNRDSGTITVNLYSRLPTPRQHHIENERKTLPLGIYLSDLSTDGVKTRLCVERCSFALSESCAMLITHESHSTKVAEERSQNCGVRNYRAEAL